MITNKLPSFLFLKYVNQKYHKKELCPHLPYGNCWRNTKLDQVGVVQAILYRLKTCCQWRELPMKQFFTKNHSWKSVYYHFQKWSKEGSFEKVWQILLEKHRHLLDMSSIQLDGTHTPVKRGGEAVGYQGRKKSKTSNLLIITDSQGIPLACSDPMAGNHNDAYQLEDTACKMLRDIEKSNLNTEGLFLNADAGFDSQKFRDLCSANEIIENIPANKRNESPCEAVFDELLYQCRFVIERTNAWLDAFKALLVRFETKKTHWKEFNLLAFSVILIRQL